jgi:DNA transposition AAA+ family ATPase
MSSFPAAFGVTHEPQRCAECCDACRRYRSIGVCYGAPGVGKSVSAQPYANWFPLQA